LTRIASQTVKSIDYSEIGIAYLNMVTYSSGGVIGFTTKLVVGVFFCFGIALLMIAATIVLSLISIYTPNHSEAGYGERKCQHKTFKTIY
jgi:hypothetical protein